MPERTGMAMLAIMAAARPIRLKARMTLRMTWPAPNSFESCPRLNILDRGWTGFLLVFARFLVAFLALARDEGGGGGCGGCAAETDTSASGGMDINSGPLATGTQ